METSIKNKKFSTQEEYFQSASPQALPLLISIQQMVENLLPSATRCISYNIPACNLETADDRAKALVTHYEY